MFPSNIQWRVFKVKQKARTNYFNITAKAEKQEDIVDLATPYSYNWPYDFCSLVELIKLDTEYKIAPNPTSPPETPDPGEVTIEDIETGGIDPDPFGGQSGTGGGNTGTQPSVPFSTTASPGPALPTPTTVAEANVNAASARMRSVMRGTTSANKNQGSVPNRRGGGGDNY